MYSEKTQEKYLTYCDTFDKYDAVCREFDNEYFASDYFFIKEHFYEIYKNLQGKLDRRNYHSCNKNNIDMCIYEEVISEDHVEKLINTCYTELNADYEELKSIYETVHNFMSSQEFYEPSK